MNESDLMRAVLDLSAHYGWRRSHARPAMTAHGWRTALQGDQGAPDLLLAREGRLLLVELKSESGRLGPGQGEWASAIGDQWRLWRPADLRNGAIQGELRR